MEIMKDIVTEHKRCRCCGGEKMSKYLDLGLMPLANNLETTHAKAKKQDKYPLQILFCHECYLSQLSVIIEPKEMFSYYTYRSGINKPYVDHCYNMAKTVFRYNLPPANHFLHVDIAGNDGTLLKEFKRYLDQKVDYYNGVSLNIDPAKNLTAISESDGIPCITDFWSRRVAKQVVNKYGKANLITATNVFAHVNDAHEFLKAVSDCLTDDGLCLIECPYIVDFIENVEFDTTYYEHLSYMSVYPIWRMCEKNGLRISRVEKINIHGGTIRLYIGKHGYVKSIGLSVIDFIENEREKGFHDFKLYKGWSNKVDALVNKFRETILHLKNQGNSIAAFGASAKGNTLLNYSLLNFEDIDFIADQTPEKIGKYSPGTGIPILDIDTIKNEAPDYVIILAWNFKDVIIEKLRKIYKGRFIIPIPKLEIID